MVTEDILIASMNAPCLLASAFPFFCCLVASALMTSIFVNSFLPRPKIPQEKECDTKVQLTTVGQSTYYQVFSSTSPIH